jgi:pseudouridine-5'-phosphate glycosidase
MKAKWDCDLEGSILVANPIPEEFEANTEIINDSMNEALAMADKKGIIGKEITPFILAHVAKVTGGDSLTANVALVENNARVGAQVAKAYSQLT